MRGWTFIVVGGKCCFRMRVREGPDEIREQLYEHVMKWCKGWEADKCLAWIRNSWETGLEATQ